jgi:hypothetical protein
LAAAYPHHEPDMVSSHNDLFKPDNMLFDGQRLWLIDWEAAFLNNRYADLAVVANLIVNNDAEEQTYLQEYFGHPPHQLARFFLVRQLAHTFYALIFLLGSSGEQVNRSESLPPLERLPSAHVGGRNKPVRQTHESRLRQSPFGRAPTKREAGTLQRSTEDRLKAACLTVPFDLKV